jgi:adenylate kinase
VVPERVLREDQSPAGTQARALAEEGKEVTPGLWAAIIHSRTQQTDCQDKGWVVEAFPRTREQALALQSEGVKATHFVHLECPDAVLIERYGGKRIDPLTGDVYHLVFSPPTSTAVAGRLVEEEGGVTANVHAPLELYHRHSHSLLTAYSATRCKTFNADQPLGDLVSQVYHFLCTRERSLAPHTPRVVLLGPSGSGKSVQAAKLAHKYNLINVDCEELVQQEMVSGGGSLADKMKPFMDSNMMIPDDMVLSVVTRRLSCLDCTSRGWVLHGFPLTGNQADLLAQAGFRPNRVFFLNLSEESVKERITQRRVDPVSGERYHLLMKPPANHEILNRLETHPHDTEEQVSKRLEIHREFAQELEDVYQLGQHVNADQDPLTVFEVIESLLVNPLPILRPVLDE